MFVRFLNDRRIRRFLEEERSRRDPPSMLVRVSDNVWQRVYPCAK